MPRSYLNLHLIRLKLVLQHQLASSEDSAIPCAGPLIQHTVFDFDKPVGDDLEGIEQLHI